MLDNFEIRYGQTRSGKTVTSQFVSNIDKYPIEDIFDAYAIFSYLTIRELRKYGWGNHYDRLEYCFLECFNFLKRRKKLELLMAQLNFKTAFDVRNFGRSLANIEFRDF